MIKKNSERGHTYMFIQVTLVFFSSVTLEGCRGACIYIRSIYMNMFYVYFLVVHVRFFWVFFGRSLLHDGALPPMTIVRGLSTIVQSGQNHYGLFACRR